MAARTSLPLLTLRRVSRPISHSRNRKQIDPHRFFTSNYSRNPQSFQRYASRRRVPHDNPNTEAHELASSQPLQARTSFSGLLWTASIAFLLSFGYLAVTDTRSGAHQWIAVPLLRALYPDAEDAHAAGVWMLKTSQLLGLNPRERDKVDGGGALSTDVLGTSVVNPIGISAGLDKNGEIASALFEMGPAVVEIGGVTPLPQYGNERPRVWRVQSQRGMVNRYGLNSKGAAYVAQQLRARLKRYANSIGLGIDEEAEQAVLDGDASVPPGSLIPGKLLAVQIAKNKATPNDDIEAISRDYVSCVHTLGKYADIIVLNVSSPNTESLRALQRREPLSRILSSVVEAVAQIDRRSKPAVMVKVSPDESSDEDIEGICYSVWSCGVDGVIVANTTTSRPPPPSPSPSASSTSPGPLLSAADARALSEKGGYSGPSLFPQTLSLVRRYREALDRPLVAAAGPSPPQNLTFAPKTIFASGGICTGEDALQVLTAGAQVAMVYTALTYGGSGFVTELKREVREGILRGVGSASGATVEEEKKEEVVTVVEEGEEAMKKGSAE